MSVNVNVIFENPNGVENLNDIIRYAIAEKLQENGIVDFTVSFASLPAGRNGMTKGRLIESLIEECVRTGNWKSRNEIAAEANATVSRVAEIVKAMTESEDSSVIDCYLGMTKEIKVAKRLEKKIAKIEAERASLTLVVNNPVVEDSENVEEIIPENVEESVSPKPAPPRNRRNKAQDVAI